MMAVVRMLAYGCPADFLDEYVQIGESTAIESLKHFCDIVIRVFETQYLRKPNTNDIVRLLKEGNDQGFLGMLGVLTVCIGVGRTVPQHGMSGALWGN
ncbi:hypothetical protein Dsin_016820 [Dipteronia sinensis]|uniref:Uncharacterized protein n=1 Tax=Dipteronia sinensis TaxID=43782 RepID=A0AAE0AE43_9ROSI|nr:hypothetical protein Dsin_016820 [Dipteronia sinensis]